MRRCIALSLAVLAFGFVSNAGVVMYDNTSGAGGGSEQIGGEPGVGPLYDSFSTGAATYSLSQVDIVIQNINPGDGAITDVGVYANNSGVPGALISTIAALADIGITSPFYTEILPVSGVTLAAGTTYWIGLSSITSDDSVQWQQTYDVSGTGLSGQHYDSTSYGVKSGPLFQMEVEADAVPEPAGYSILVFAIAALAMAKRRHDCVGT
jgi:hypothetical protein